MTTELISCIIVGGAEVLLLKEEITGGYKEFAIAMVIAAILYFISYIIVEIFGIWNYRFIGAAVAVIVFSVFGFYVMTRYSARFTYELHGNRLRINRIIGKRNKEIEVNVSRIEGMYFGYKPSDFPKRPYIMRKSIIKNKKSLFIDFKTKRGERMGVVIEPSENLRKKIEIQRDKVEIDD